MPDIYLYDDEFIVTGSRTSSIILTDPTTLYSFGGGPPPNTRRYRLLMGVGTVFLAFVGLTFIGV